MYWDWWVRSAWRLNVDMDLCRKTLTTSLNYLRISRGVAVMMMSIRNKGDILQFRLMMLYIVCIGYPNLLMSTQEKKQNKNDCLGETGLYLVCGVKMFPHLKYMTSQSDCSLWILNLEHFMLYEVKQVRLKSLHPVCSKRMQNDTYKQDATTTAINTHTFFVTAINLREI